MTKTLKLDLSAVSTPQLRRAVRLALNPVYCFRARISITLLGLDCQSAVLRQTCSTNLRPPDDSKT